MRPWMLVAFLSLFLPGIARGERLPSGFELQTVYAPLAFGHVAFEFLPDGRLIFLHKTTGAVSLWRDGLSTPALLINIPNLFTDGERGLLDVAVDPQWPTRPYLYFYLNHSSGTSRVVLYQVTGDLTNASSSQLTLANPYWVLDDIPNTANTHKGGTLRFDPSGMLLVSTGDDQQFCVSQDLSSLLGKLLRLNVSSLPQPGSGPPAKSQITPSDNPFTGPDDNARLVLALGLRNPFRFDVDPQSGDVLIGDVGSTFWEEVDALPIDATERNFGWPIFEGDEPHPEHTDLSCGVGSNFVEPVFQYERGTQQAAIIGGVFYRQLGGGFGAEYDGDFFFYDFLRRHLRRLKTTPNGWALAAAAPGQPSALNWAEELGAASCFRVGPDGALYFLNYRSDTGMPAAGFYRIVRTSVVAAPPGAAQPQWFVRVSPNPAEGMDFAFNYELERQAAMRLRIFDATGRLVRTVRQVAPAGVQTTLWDGRGEDRAKVAAGVYFYQLDDGDGRQARGKLTVVR